ncbi:fructose-specific PTS transporter subunit EIIC [Spiroplasma endosymbiont of Zeiraphera isertana]|uniref:PTS fructose transporter subunit IIABC n=1 Tax=Spiroplasma endosymbiont of Zeiraphera isertana TaxID=3066313 RepID=UPI00313A774F
MKITNDLLNDSHIIFESNIKNQIEALTKITDLAFSLGYITNRDELLKAFLAREQESSTGFEGGIAIPHARIKSIKKPAILILCNNNGVDWKAIDGQLTTFIIALIIPETQAENLHLDILSTLAIKLLNEDFRKKLKNAKNSQEIISLINDETVKNSTKKEIKTMKNKKTKKIIGVSSCTTGVVHTYMCKELLETAGKEIGYQVHIECQSQKGPEYVLTEQEIKEADVVILATDVAIDLERFIGKKTYTCGTKPVVKDAKQTIKESLTKAKIYGEPNGNSGDFILNASKGKPAILKHLFSWVSYMIPFVVFAGLIFAIVGGIAKGTFGNGFEFKNSWEEQLAWLKTNPPGVNSGLIGGTTLMHVLMIITFLLVSPGTGMWFGWGVFNLTASSKIDASQPFQGNANVSWTLFGSLYGGLMAGYLVRFVNSWKVPKWLLPIMPIIIIPVFCTAIIAIPTAFFLAAPFGYVMGALDYGLSWMGLHPNIGFLVGLLLGAMVGLDMGGPINKTAVLVATSLMVQDGGRLMGPVAAAIPIAPLGCALTSTVFSRKLFTKQEQSLGWNAWLLGFMGISESAIPFAVRDTWRTIVANVIGSAVAGALAFGFGVLGHVGAWGSFIIALFGGVTNINGSYIGILWYAVAIIIGTVVQSIIYTSLLLQKQGLYRSSILTLLNKIGIKTKNKKTWVVNINGTVF